MAFISSKPQAATAATIPVNPFQWYVNWVRANPENAGSLERLSRTASLIFCNHNNLLSMESFSALSKVHRSCNQVILQTAYRRVTGSEVIIYLLQVIQEVECLFELTLRQYSSHARAWDALVALQALKCVLNACVHRQLFLVPWMWGSIRRSVQRVLAMILRLPRQLLSMGTEQEASKAAAGRDKSREMASRSVMGSVLGPNGVRLVIPRVISERRRGLDGAIVRPTAHSRTASNSRCSDQDEEPNTEDGGAEVPFTWIDIFGLVIDGFMLLRPLLLVCVARGCFPKDSSANQIARLTQPPDSPERAKDEAKDAKKSNSTDAAAAPNSKVEGPHWMTQATMAAAPLETLFSNWRWWALFALMDGFVLLAARFIRVNRVPVVYIHSTTENKGLEAGEGSLERSHRGNDSLIEDREVGEGGRSSPAPQMNLVYELPVVSRDSLRAQQALRNVAYNFLRDPFFTMAIKQFIYQHFVKGFINRIPLLGSLVAFQVSYYLAMRHYSFMYSVGQ